MMTSRKSCQTGGQRRYIGERRRREHTPGAPGFVIGEQAAFFDGGKRPPAGIEFYRKGDELEQRHQPEQQDADAHQQGEIQQQAHKKDGDGERRADIGDGDDGAAQPQGTVFLGVLDGVAALVRGDPDGGDGGAVVDPLRKMDDIGAGIVVVGQFARDLIDPDIGKPVVIEDLAGDLGGGASPHAADRG